MNKYITTAIYYANSKLHIGSAYEIIYADALTRYEKMLGNDVRFMTGMDEHGEKIFNSAKSANMHPQNFVDKIASDTKDLFEHLKISYDKFIRTTDKDHQQVVKNVFDRLLKQGDIYLSEYEGNYCVSCESFYPESQLVKGKCPVCNKDVSIIKEESYFLNLKKYEERLKSHINENANFIVPETRKNEILSFLENGLEDLSVTRVSLEWGIPILNDPKHVIYVWIDALTNYISGLGYPDDELYEKYWNNAEVIHVVGKDILRFHTVYWPIVLMSLGEKLPTSIVSHAFVLMDNEKMSKSVGNIIDPLDYVKNYGEDPLRYYLLSEMALSNDGSFSFTSFIEKYNYDLVNDLSNLVNRTISMAKKYFDNEIKYGKDVDLRESLEQSLHDTFTSCKERMSCFETKPTLQNIWKYIARVNKFIDETEPWVLVKTDPAKLESVLYLLLDSLRNIATLIRPFMCETSDKIFDQLNVAKELNFDNLSYNYDKEYSVAKPQIIYNRLDIEEERDKMCDSSVDENKKEFIEFDDFSKLELRVATVVECVQHPNADKLLLFKLQVGGEMRQIISGIAEFYKPEELVGKNVVIVANLKPIKLRGEISQGMILSAEKDGDLNVLMTQIDNGGIVA